MIRMLENKLFAFETFSSEPKKMYLFLLCDDIRRLVSRIREENLYSLLTLKDKETIKSVERFYIENKEIGLLLGY